MRSPAQTNQTSQISVPTEEDSQPPPEIMGAGEDSQPVLPNLPPEIMVEILLRLPVKSLLRLRCVCKSWRSLISQRKFAKTHLSLASSINDPDYPHHRLLITNVNHDYTYHGVLSTDVLSVVLSCSLYSILNDTVVQLDYPLRGDSCVGYRGVIILGGCDGLMCIKTRRTLFLWNPSTRKSKRLPSVNMPTDLVVYGFGRDASIDDYKVVGFGIDFEVKVYTVRTDLWRRIGDFPHGHGHLLPHRYRSGVFVSGALHWNVSTKTTGIIVGIIVSLDLATEAYGELLKPGCRGYCFDEILWAFNGCLHVLYHTPVSVNVWVMKEYGITESWTMLVVVPHVTIPSVLKFIIPLCILKNGEVLLVIHENLVRYNPKDGSFGYRTIDNNLEFCSVHPYVESLVSVDMDAADRGDPWQYQH